MNNAEKVVVFGGAGFLGSHVADALTKKGYEVIIFDLVQSKYINEKQKMVIGDINDLDRIKQTVKGAQFVYHFAGLADINISKKKPVETVKNNILGTTYVLEACNEFKIKRIVFASTIYVYSDLGSFYRSSKQACEMLIENYSDEYKLDYTILRYGSLYGHRANNFNFIKNAITQALVEGEIKRKGNGEEIRDYIHVIDAAKASVEILNDKYINSHIMIKGTQTIKVKNLLMMINEILGNNIKIKYTKGDQYEGHYQLTPYSFRPRVAEKLLLKTYYDLGQGLLDSVYDIYQELHKENSDNLVKISLSPPKKK